MAYVTETLKVNQLNPCPHLSLSYVCVNVFHICESTNNHQLFLWDYLSSLHHWKVRYFIIKCFSSEQKMLVIYCRSRTKIIVKELKTKTRQLEVLDYSLIHTKSTTDLHSQMFARSQSKLQHPATRTTKINKWNCHGTILQLTHPDTCAFCQHTSHN